MFRPQALLIPVLCAIIARAADFSGASAMEFTKQVVALGPRPSGSEANRKLQAYILNHVKQDGCEVAEDAFTARNPAGESIPMKNIIAKFPGKSGRAIAITGHFDTKYFPGRTFVGANDGGSSTALLLELARVLNHQPRTDDVYLVWFDGEEAFGEWTATDSVYGSRHLAEKWQKDGTLPRIKALINVDMIGDKKLGLQQDSNSTAFLNKLVWQTASELGYKAYFLDKTLAMDDDHMPFLKLGVPAIDLIDFDYPPWHEDTDTLDKVSAHSLEIVGTVVAEAIHRLEQR